MIDIYVFYDIIVLKNLCSEKRKKMTKVTLLGDSIRENYAPKTIKLLGDDFEVFHPNENCRFSKYTLRGIFDFWANDMEGSDIVHWNNGHWDTCNLFGDGHFTPEDEYVRNMLRIADHLQKNYKKVIFATITPVRDTNIHHKTADSIKFNNLIVPELEKRGIIINDLFSVVIKDVEKYIREDDNIHLTEAGKEVCAEQVAKVIKEVAKTL